MVATQRLEHRQVYIYKFHRAKLNLLEGVLPRRVDFHRLRQYLISIQDEGFPNRIFSPQNDLESESQRLAHRSSQSSAQFLPITHTRKRNLANELAAHGLLLAKTSKARHQQIQDFMLINDSSTLACEVPVYLTATKMEYFRRKGFILPITKEDAPITGHIDILQARQGYIHILDYKPEAARIRPISQLAIYALALASLSKLPLKLFKCAWFDEKDYYEFFPLRSVYAPTA